MKFDDILLGSEKVQHTSKLLDQIERQQRLMQPAIRGFFSQVEQLQNFFSPFPLELAHQTDKYRRLIEGPAREVAHIAKLLNANLNSSLAEFQRVVFQQKQLMEPALVTLSRAWSEHQIAAQQLTDQFRTTRNTLRGLSTWAEGINQQFTATSQAFSDLNTLVESSAGPALRFIASEFDRVVFDTEHFRNFQKTFASDLIDYLIRIQAAEKAQHEDVVLEGLPELITRSLEDLPKTRLSLEGAIQIFLTIFLFVWSQVSSMQTEERVAREFRSLGDRIALELSSLKQEKFLPTRYVVLKPARLRQGPSVDQPILAVLQPNMVIELCQMSGQWMQVKYFDFVISEVREGWIFKRNLKAITD
ncbi:MAG TPA: SH3 domain-containing protein [Nitrospira sp.]|jgi:hypothetical protein|nr:SH3 domain-containing protein [Nitrospira sp.]